MALAVPCLLLLTIAVSFTTADIRLVDLSHVHTPNVYGAPPGPSSYTLTTIFAGQASGGYTELNQIETLEHAGTHFDAPKHVNKDGRTVDEIPLVQTIAPGVVIDCSCEAAQDPEYSVPVSKIQEWESNYGRIPQKAAVLFNFGYSALYDNETVYKGTEDVNDILAYRIPSVSVEAFRYLLSNRNIKILGVDTLSPDPYQINGVTSGFPIHREFLPQNGVIVENLRDLNQLPPRGFVFIGAPVKFENASGTPIRAFAMVFDGYDKKIVRRFDLWNTGKRYGYD